MKNFIVTFLFCLLVGALAWTITRHISLRKEYINMASEYQRALQKYKDEPLIVLDTIFDTVDNTVAHIYEPIRTTGEVEDYISKGLADTMAMKLKTASKRINSLESYVINLQDSLQGYRHEDEHGVEWLSTKDDPVFDIKVNLRTDTIYAGAKIGVDRANARVRKTIFHPWEYRTAIRSRDARITITDIRDVQKVPKPSKFGIGFTVGPTFTSQGISYGASAGLSYHLISF